jgi:hypothetical protein
VATSPARSTAAKTGGRSARMDHLIGIDLARLAVSGEFAGLILNEAIS